MRPKRIPDRARSYTPEPSGAAPARRPGPFPSVASARRPYQADLRPQMAEASQGRRHNRKSTREKKVVVGDGFEPSKA